MKDGPWSKEDIDFLIKNYEKYSRQELSLILKRNINSIGTKAYRLGCNKKLPEFSDEEFLNAIKDSSSHVEACRKLGYSKKIKGKIYNSFFERLKPDISHFCLYSRSRACDTKYSPLESKYNEIKYHTIEYKKLEFTLSLDEYIILSNSKCYYCGNQGNTKLTRHKDCNKEDIFGCGIDRINSNLGYIKENCVSCCWDCNEMKKARNKESFLLKIKNIYENLQLDKFYEKKN